MCYNCSKKADTNAEILDHTIDCHSDKVTKFSLRKKTLHEKSGHELYTSIHFDRTLQTLKEHRLCGDKIFVDTINNTIRFKRAATSTPTSSTAPPTSTPTHSTASPTRGPGETGTYNESQTDYDFCLSVNWSSHSAFAEYGSIIRFL